jgi:predicted nucleotidyltransferase
MTLQAAFLNLPPLQQRERLPLSVIEALVQHIVEHFSPDKIILFGSYAYGEPTRWSDVDLLVVMDVPPEKAAEMMMKIRRSLPPRSFGLDVIVHSQATIDHRIPLGDWFLEEVTNQGKVMYERTGSRVGQQSR